MKKPEVKFPLLIALMALAAQATACVSPTGETDPYSMVASVCMTQDPLMGQDLSATPEKLVQTYLTPECRTALLGVIPYDSTWATAPTGMQDKVTEAFQAIIAYPLLVDPNDSKYLGTSPQIAGAIPLAFYDIYQEYPNPNQSLFNYILTHTDVITYGGNNNNIDASYVPSVTSEPRKITIFEGFWNQGWWQEKYRNPFLRASTLAHEARHGDTILHLLCEPSYNNESASSWECDPELQGPYGFAGTYMKFLIHGSGTCATPGCTPPISQWNVWEAGWEMCIAARNRINNRYPELDALVGVPALPITQDFCGSATLTYDWVMQREGVTPPPAAPAGGSVDGSLQGLKAYLQQYGAGDQPHCDYH